MPEGPAEIDVSGADASTVQAREAGDASTLPAASTARTSKLCEPFARPEYAFGELQAPQAEPSRRHSNVEPDSEEANDKLAAVEDVVPEGPAEIDVSGAVVSPGAVTVQARDAAVASVLPAASLARTSNVCVPTARPV